MLKAILLASSMMIAAPALAQQVPAGDTTQHPPQENAPPTRDDMTGAPAKPGTTGAGVADEASPSERATEFEPGQPAPATETAQPTPEAPAGANAPDAASAQPATSMPATSAEQVAQAVGRQFAGYDKDSDGALNRAEFGAWMVALRQASEPGFTPGSPEAESWTAQAFAASDTDKSQSISQSELAAFLTPKAAS